MKVIQSDILNRTLKYIIQKYFPELKNREIEVYFTFKDKDFGAAKAENKIILYMPAVDIDFEGHGIKILIAHELCHFINLENPQIEFQKRMPSEYSKLWERLEKEGELSCDRGTSGFKRTN